MIHNTTQNSSDNHRSSYVACWKGGSGFLEYAKSRQIDTMNEPNLDDICTQESSSASNNICSSLTYITSHVRRVVILS